MPVSRSGKGIAWAAVAVGVAVVAGGVLLFRSFAPSQHGEGRLLSSRPSLFAQPVVVDTPDGDPGPEAGTAFSISSKGVWLTARHVVQGCPRVVVMEAPGLGAEAVPVATADVDRANDLAVLRTEGGAPPLRFAEDTRLRVGQSALQPGFPQGRPGAVTSRLLSRQTLLRRTRGIRGRGRRMPVLTWAETGRSRGLEGDLDGLSGAPVLDSAGRVVGLTVAEAPRRGRLYALPPEALAEVFKAFGSVPSPGQNAGSPPSADQLRHALTVAQVICLPRP